jgi:phosphatidylinositol-3-phosphatase
MTRMRVAAAAAFAAGIAAAGATAGTQVRGPCGGDAGRPAAITHVIWIWLENHSTGEVIGSHAPAIAALAHDCGLATDYRAVAHPSLPNYIAATSGSTQGIADDGSPSQHPLPVASIFSQAPSSGSYEESMPSPCFLTNRYPYAPRHNPEVYYTRFRASCARNDVPLGSIASGPFVQALRSGSLPAFSFVTPNLCDDMHDCTIPAGNAWLQAWIPAITSSATYRAGHTVVFVAWDEDDGSAGNRVPLVVVSPYTRPGTRSAAPFGHYSLLRTTEELLGIRPYLGRAASAPSMRSAFGLRP